MAVEDYRRTLSECRNALAHGTVLGGGTLVFIIGILEQASAASDKVGQKYALRQLLPNGVRKKLDNDLAGACADCMSVHVDAGLQHNAMLDG